VIRLTQPLTTAAILSKTYYNVNAHQPESVDWFNVLVAQTIAQLRKDAQHDNAILTTLNNVLNGPAKPDFLDAIRVTEINLGEEFPIFSNCRVIPVESGEGGGPNDGRLQARMDVDLSDAVTLGIETKLILNYPKPLVAVMPVALAVSVVRFSGTLSISFIPSPSASPDESAADVLANSATPPTTLTFSFMPDYRLELSTHSLLGSRSRLQDVPKIAQLVESRLHAWFDERCVEPRFQQVALPSLWPRRKNTRGGEKEEEEGRDKGDTPGKSPRNKRNSMDAGVLAAESSPRLKPEQQGLRERRMSAKKSHERLRPEGGSLSRDISRLRMPGSMPL